MNKELNTNKLDKILDNLDEVLESLGEEREYDVLELEDQDGNMVEFLILCSYAINDDYYALCEDEEGYVVFRTKKDKDGDILYFDVDNETELLEALEAGIEALESIK